MEYDTQLDVPLLTIQGVNNVLHIATDSPKAPTAEPQSMETTPRSTDRTERKQPTPIIMVENQLLKTEDEQSKAYTSACDEVTMVHRKSIESLGNKLSPLPLDSTCRSVRLPSICTELTFRETAPACQALQQNVGIAEDLDYAMRPLTLCRALLSGTSKLLQYSSSAILVSLSCFGLAMCFLCYYWKTQEKDKALEKTFGGGATSIATLFTHFLQGVVAVYYMMKTDENLPKFIELWLEAYASCKNQHPPVKKLRRLSVFLACYVFLGSLVLTVLWSVGFMHATPYLTFSDNCSCFFPPVEGAPRFLNGILLGLVTLPNLYCQAMYAMLCMILFYEFWHFGNQFDSVYQSENPEAFLASYRQQHHQLTRLTDFVDDHLSYYAWWIYCLNIPAVCLVLYALFLDDSIEIGGIIGLCIWCFQLTSQILLVSVPPAAITHQEFASRPRDPTVDRDWFTIAAKDTNVSTTRSVVVPLTQDTYQQINLFLQQLTGRVIGITCGGFFMLTKEMLLTLVSVLITYFALILQLDMGDGTKCDCVCNATSGLPVTITTLLPE